MFSHSNLQLKIVTVNFVQNFAGSKHTHQAWFLLTPSILYKFYRSCINNPTQICGILPWEFQLARQCRNSRVKKKSSRRSCKINYYFLTIVFFSNTKPEPATSHIQSAVLFSHSTSHRPRPAEQSVRNFF